MPPSLEMPKRASDGEVELSAYEAKRACNMRENAEVQAYDGFSPVPLSRVIRRCDRA